MKPIILTTLLLLFFATDVSADADREIRGRVFDEAGRPAANVDVTNWWNANGPPDLKDPQGKPYDADTSEGARAISAELGKMHPWGEKPAKTGPDGRFSIRIPETQHHLMTMDESRRHGAVVILPKGRDLDDVEMRLVPLVRLRGSFDGPEAGERPKGWMMVTANVPEDPERPLDGTRLVLSGSVDARFEMALPPGRYFFEMYAWRGKDSEEMSQIRPDMEVLLTGKSLEVDLGTIRLPAYVPHLGTRIARAKAAGTWNDYTKHYGEKLPAWQIADARGVKRDAQIRDFKGKWVLVYFWGWGCNTCLRDGVPKLIKFYDEHQAERERFEIVSICVDAEGEINSFAALDKKLESIVKNAWGKPLPFPVLLDPTFASWERYGLPYLPTILLVDPEGRLVEGDETTLATKLKAP